MVIPNELVAPQVTLVPKGPRTTTLVAFGAQTRKVTPVILDPLLLMFAPSSWAREVDSDLMQIKQTMIKPSSLCWLLTLKYLYKVGLSQKSRPSGSI